MADQKISDVSEISVPALDDFTVWVDNGATTRYRVSATRLMALLAQAPGGRLTTETAVAISTSDRTAQGTLYYTPYLHNRIRIYDGTRWRLYSFSELSLALTVTSGNNYDVFVYDNAGTLTLELSAAWTNATTRADALTTQDGVQVKSGATTRLWLGTIRASGANVVEDSQLKRYVWNAYNKVERLLFVEETEASWTYTSTANWRQVRGQTDNQVDVVVGDASSRIQLQSVALCTIPASGAGPSGIGVDSTTAIATTCVTSYTGRAATDNVAMLSVGRLVQYVPLGYHYFAWLESNTNASNTVTFFGTSSAFRRIGMTGSIAA